jgi:hypothetical protein
MLADTERELERLSAVVEEQGRVIEALRARLDDGEGPATSPSGAEAPSPARSRRDLLRLAGLAAAGGVGAALHAASPAAADTGDPLVLGFGNDASTTTVLQNEGVVTGIAMLRVSANVAGNTNSTDGVQGFGSGTRFGLYGLGGPTGGIGVYGDGGVTNGRGVHGAGKGTGAGVFGSGGTTSGFGVHGVGGAPNGVGVAGAGLGTGSGIECQGGTSAGLGIFARGGTGGGTGVYGWGNTVGAGVTGEGGAASGTGVEAYGGAPNGVGLYATTFGTGAQLLLQPKASAGPPASAAHAKGEVVLDANAVVWVCTAAGTPGTWERLVSTAGTNAPGAVTFLSRPVRVRDTRPSIGKLAAGASHSFVVPGTYDGVTIPATARGIVGTLTVTGTEGASGYLTAYPQGAAPTPAQATSNVNWFGPNQNIATAVVCGLNAGNDQITIHNGLAGGSNATHYLLDVAGYTI